MQFKVISALVFATLAAASAIPDNNPANASPATTPSNPTTGNTKPGNTNPSNTNSGAKVAPPFPATNGGTPPTIDASKCSSGHLLCCKSEGLPTDPTVAAKLPSGISASSFSGYAGFNCLGLADGAQPDTCTDKPLCCTDITNFIGCNPATLGL